ncbi:MAG: PspC domain-containing protein [Firmicutes bacterium]|nr:PspC domain-containing protein [Bacillota bacterium]
MEKKAREVSCLQYRRLTRSRTNRILTGLCGGIGEYLNVDPVIIRLLWLFVPGPNLIAYLIASLIVPEA